MAGAGGLPDDGVRGRRQAPAEQRVLYDGVRGEGFPGGNNGLRGCEHIPALQQDRKAAMAATREIELECWVCGEQFVREEPRAYAVTGRGSDLCPQPVGFNPLPLLLHTCPTCGFTADGRGFHRSQHDEEVRNWVLAGGLTRVADEMPDADCARYEMAALCEARRIQPSALQLAEYYLAASWLAQLDEALDVVDDYQEKAAQYLEQALLVGELEDKERAVMTYLVGELRRRLGEFEAALKLFDEAAVQYAEHGGPQWMVRALNQQARMARERSSEAASLAQ